MIATRNERSLRLLWTVVFSISCLKICSATRHSFYTVDDPRLWIGPLGPPFGFLPGGVYNLTVVDFQLKDNQQFFSLEPQEGTPVRDPKRVTEVGFLLKRFKSESEFFKYYEMILANNTCIFPQKTPVGSGDPDDFDLSAMSFNDDDEVKHSNTGVAADPAGEGIRLSMKPSLLAGFDRNKPIFFSDQHTFKSGEQGLYFLMYQVCDEDGALSRLRSTFTLDFHFCNKDVRGNVSFLSAGEMALPSVYFFFFTSFALCSFIWMLNIRQIQLGKESLFADSGRRPVVFAIHQFISLLLILKTCTLLMESLRYHYISVSGHAEFWSVMYYLLSFLKGTFMFTVILLIGSGWSFVKSYLTQREKTVILVVLVLQVLDNIAIAVLSQETQGERSFASWNATMHLIDILCCCAILLPLVWQVNALEKSLERHENGEDSEEALPLEVNGAPANTNHVARSSSEEAEKNEILSKLRLFRSFYLLVVAYIYLTRVVVYLFTTALDYRHLWIQHMLVELVTLTFFVIIGLKFRPMEANPYFAIHQHNAEVEEYEVELQPTIMERVKDAKFS